MCRKDTVHIEVIYVLGQLGRVYGNKGDYGLALEYYSRCLAMYNRLYPDDTPHNDIATTKSNMAASTGVRDVMMRL